MEMSPQINEIAAALAKAQAGLGKLIASKTADAGTYQYAYADLGLALEACRSTLNEQGIAVVQEPATSERNGIEVRTMLVHASGQWMRSDPLFMPVKGGAQDVGSSITYGRRYQLLAMVGLAPEDDDGAAAQAAKPDSWGQRRKPEPAKRDAVGPRCRGKAAAKATKLDGLIRKIAAAEDIELQAVWDQLWDAARVEIAPYLAADGKAPTVNDLGVKDADAMIKEADHWLREVPGD